MRPEEGSLPASRSRRHPAGNRLRPRGAARLIAVACLLTALAAVTSCGTSGTASSRPSSSGDVRAYVDCLFSHTKDSGGTGPRRACQSQRPAGGLGPALQAFASCLNRHGVVLPSQSPGTTVSGSLRYLSQLRSGTSAQRAAFNACLSGVR